MSNSYFVLYLSKTKKQHIMAAYVSTDNRPEENLPNRAVFQSYIWTCAKYDFSPYEKRIIYRLIEFAQRWIEGVKLKDNLRKIEPSDCGMNITMPVADILRDENDHNYAKQRPPLLPSQRKGQNTRTTRFGSTLP